MLNGVLLEMSFNCFEQECCDFLLDQLLPEGFIEAQVGEVSATLSVMLNILRVFQHVSHKVDSIIRGNNLVAIKDFRDMRKRCCGIERRL